MKRYTIYRSIREQALIFGLPVSGLAIQMISIIGGLLLIIFSFSLSVILLAVGFNVGLYVFLLRSKEFPRVYSIQRLTIVSNKQIGISSYEN